MRASWSHGVNALAIPCEGVEQRQGRTNQSPCRTDPESLCEIFESRSGGNSLVDEEKFVGYQQGLTKIFLASDALSPRKSCAVRSSCGFGGRERIRAYRKREIVSALFAGFRSARSIESWASFWARSMTKGSFKAKRACCGTVVSTRLGA